MNLYKYKILSIVSYLWCYFQCVTLLFNIWILVTEYILLFVCLNDTRLVTKFVKCIEPGKWKVSLRYPIQNNNSRNMSTLLTPCLTNLLNVLEWLVIPRLWFKFRSSNRGLDTKVVDKRDRGNFSIHLKFICMFNYSQVFAISGKVPRPQAQDWRSTFLSDVGTSLINAFSTYLSIMYFFI